jgi:hypothetical protein
MGRGIRHWLFVPQGCMTDATPSLTMSLSSFFKGGYSAKRPTLFLFLRCEPDCPVLGQINAVRSAPRTPSIESTPVPRSQRLAQHRHSNRPADPAQNIGPLLSRAGSALSGLTAHPYLLKCLLMAFVIWNISNRAFPNTGFSLSSATISRRFFGSCSLCFLM